MSGADAIAYGSRMRHPGLFLFVCALVVLLPLARHELRYFCLAGRMWWRQQPLLVCLIEARLCDNLWAERRIAAHYRRWLNIIDSLDRGAFALLVFGAAIAAARITPLVTHWMQQISAFLPFQ